MKQLLRLGLICSMLVAQCSMLNIAHADSSSLIKGSGSAVYFLSSDDKRYVFPTEGVYKSWYVSSTKITTMSDTELATIPLGGNVTYKPGVKLVKITTDPKVYAVSKYGILHWVTSEALATTLYGADWNKQVVDVPDAFFVNYIVGSQIDVASQFDRTLEMSVTSPDDNVKRAVVLTPMLTVSGHPSPNQVSITILAPSGNGISETLIKDGTKITDPTIAICNQSTCSITMQVNTAGSVTAFTTVNGNVQQSNTITVAPVAQY